MRKRLVVGVPSLEEHGTIQVERVDDDYSNVVVGPMGESDCVATGYVCKRDTIVSVNLPFDEVTEAPRWFAYDTSQNATEGTCVGRKNAGYPTHDRAVKALVSEYVDRLEQEGLWVGDAGGDKTKAWGDDDIRACPYVTDDEYARYIRVDWDDAMAEPRNDTLPDKVSELMGDTHGLAVTRARVVASRLADLMGPAAPAWRRCGVNPTFSFHTELACDSYGNVSFDNGDPFRCITVGLGFCVYEDGVQGDGDDEDGERTRHKPGIPLHGSLEFDVYENAERPGDDPMQIVWCASVDGKWCRSNDGLLHNAMLDRNIYLKGSGAELHEEPGGPGEAEEIRRAVEDGFYPFLGIVSTSLIGRENEPAGERSED